jgi:hypothetical protein
VDVLTNPKLGGYDQALRAIREELPDRYGFWDLWIFLPDADRVSAEAMRHLETELRDKSITLLCCPAQPEVEIYACAAYHKEVEGAWEAARLDCRMKEDIFEALLRKHGDDRRAGGGRDLMIAASLKNLPLLFQLCPELKILRDRIANLVQCR